MHRLLARQVQRHIPGTVPGDGWAALLDAVSDAYHQADRDRALLERAMELASQELLETNQHLQAERTRLQLAFANAPAAIALFHGAEHGIMLANSTFQVLTGRSDVVGRTFTDVFPELVDSPMHLALRRAWETGEPVHAAEMEIHLGRDRSGKLEQTYWNMVLQPLAGADGAISDVMIHAVEITAQVTARRQAEDHAAELQRIAHALEESNQDLDQFAYVASHDLKTPLRGIASLTEWIEADLGDDAPEETRAHLELLHVRVHRLEALINGILEYSRAGRDRGSEQMVDVGELIEEIRELGWGPEGRVVVHGDLPVIRSQRMPLQQVFQNLISNGLKYGGRDGMEPVVEVRAADRGAFWEFTVSDNGPGIPAEHRERVFGLFQRLHAKDEVEGSGIGLALVRRILQRRGGSVRLESPPEGGACFVIRMPKAPAAGSGTTPGARKRRREQRRMPDAPPGTASERVSG